MSDDTDTATLPTPAPPEPAPSGEGPAGHHDAANDLDLLAEDDSTETQDSDEDDSADQAEVPDAEAEESEPSSPWPERPADLDASDEDAVARWKEEMGLAARDEYELPELPDGREYTPQGRALNEQITQLGYELDLSPDQTQQLLLRGDPLLRAFVESRDAEDQRSGSKALLAEFDGDREAAQRHVAQARSALKRSLPEGLGETVLEARGPDGRRLAYNPDFLRWAAELGTRPQGKGRHAMTQDLQAERQELIAVRDRDVSELRRPWRGTGKSGSDRLLEIQRQLDAQAAAHARHAADRDARSDEERELLRLAEIDRPTFEYLRNQPGGKTGAERLVELRKQRKQGAAA